MMTMEEGPKGGLDGVRVYLPLVSVLLNDLPFCLWLFASTVKGGRICHRNRE